MKDGVPNGMTNWSSDIPECELNKKEDGVCLGQEQYARESVWYCTETFQDISPIFTFIAFSLTLSPKPIHVGDCVNYNQGQTFSHLFILAWMGQFEVPDKRQVNINLIPNLAQYMNNRNKNYRVTFINSIGYFS